MVFREVKTKISDSTIPFERGTQRQLNESSLRIKQNSYHVNDGIKKLTGRNSAKRAKKTPKQIKSEETNKNSKSSLWVRSRIHGFYERYLFSEFELKRVEANKIRERDAAINLRY